MKKFIFFSLSGLILIYLLSTLLPKGPQDLPTSHVQVHQILRQRLTPENCRPLGGTHVRSEAHWYWGFPDGFPAPDAAAFPVKITVNGYPLMIKGGLYYPSHLVLESETDSAKSNLACNPLKHGFPQPITSFSQQKDAWGPIDGCPSNATSWHGDGSTDAPDWYGVDLGEPRVILSAVLEFLESETVKLPTSYFLEYEENGQWVKIPEQHFYPATPGSGKNLAQFPRLTVRKIRVVMSGGGLLNFQLQGAGTRLPLVTEKKFITEDNVLFSCFTFQNLSWHSPLTVHFHGLTPWEKLRSENAVWGELNGQQLVLTTANLPNSDESTGKIEFDLPLKPREKKEIRFVITADRSRKLAQQKAEQWRTQNLPIEKQVRFFNAWFNRNIPYFFSSNSCFNQAYYRHWNQIRLQLLQSRTNIFNFPEANSENPDTTINLVNQFIREIRWLREADVAQNFIRNYNKYALSHPDDFRAFLISGMWALDQVHPDRNFLTSQSVISEKLLRQLAENYDRNQNQLLEISEEVGVAGFTSTMYLPEGGIEPIGLNAELFRASAALDSTARVYGLNTSRRSQKVGQTLLERTWDGYFWPIGATTGAPIFVFEPSGLKPFIYDLAETQHLAAWERVLPHVRTILKSEKGILSPVLFRAMLRTWQRFPKGPVTRTDLFQVFNSYYCNELVPSATGSNGTFITAHQVDPSRPGIDFFIQGIPGVNPQSNAKQLLLNPVLSDAAVSFFGIENLAYHGHKFTIIWDRPDSTDQFADNRDGFDIYVDGHLAGSSARLQRIVVKL